MDPLVMLRADQLHLQVVEITQALLYKHPAIPELALGIILDLAVNTAELFYPGHFFNAHAATAGSCLHQD